ncbi:unnamed protein product [Rotaria sordida]|uniref:Uncharacterized protein n=1 Tax=Rotaria sordida TaxID=392033 RepID=A0A815SFW8_9BILA|nr:unnamed protein product [Rotaria sordida]
MSTIETNLKNQPIVSISVSPQAIKSLPPPSLSISTTSSLTPNTSSATIFYDDKQIEKTYKKGKQILFEFDQIVKDDIDDDDDDELKLISQE